MGLQKVCRKLFKGSLLNCRNSLFTMIFLSMHRQMPKLLTWEERDFYIRVYSRSDTCFKNFTQIITQKMCPQWQGLLYLNLFCTCSTTSAANHLGIKYNVASSLWYKNEPGTNMNYIE